MKWCVVAAVLGCCATAQTSGVIAYTRAPEGDPAWPVRDICTVSVDGSRDRCLTNDGHSHGAAWSPDGKWLVFIRDATLSTPPPYRETETTQSHHPVELSIMDADGRNRRVLRVIEPVIYSIAWSPDGAIPAISAATAARPGEAPQAGVFVLPASGKGDLRLFRKDAWTPSWSPDGKLLAFTVEHPRGRWRVYTAKIDGTEETALGEADIDNGSPAWSPDGAQIAFDQFTGASSQQQVFLMNADGSGKRQLTTDPAWSLHASVMVPGRQAPGCLLPIRFIAMRHGILLDGPEDAGVRSAHLYRDRRAWLRQSESVRSRWSHGFLAAVTMT